MSYAQAHRYEREAARLGVSEVARGPGGFMRVYEKARDARTMRQVPVGNITWERRRDNFVRRHLVQYRKHPTYRRWLALAMWAYHATPCPSDVPAQQHARTCSPPSVNRK